MKYPVIKDREIVPVRLIPLITNAWLGQVALSGILANRVKVSGWPYPSDQNQFKVNIYDEATGCTEHATITRAKLIGPQQRDNRVHAYHLNDDGIPVKMLSSEWEAIYRDISVIEPLLRKTEEKNGVPDSKESAWRLKVTKILPPGVFLWREDLDLLWKAHISSFIHTKNERPDFRKMNYDAYIRPKYRKLVWEGFEHLIQAGSKVSTSPPSLSPVVVSIAMTQSIINQTERPDLSNKMSQVQGIPATISLDEPTPAQDSTERADLFNRKGAVVPKEKRRRTSSFTDVMVYLFQLCREMDKDELLVPGNPDGFMEYVKKLANDGKKQDAYVAERIASVRSGNNGYIEMQDGHGRTKPKKGIDAYKYPRIEIQKALSALRNKPSQSVE